MPALWPRANLPDSPTNASFYGSQAAEHAGAGTYEEAHHELFRIVPEVSVVHLAYTLLSVFTVIFGMFSAFIKEKLYAGEAIIALCVGIGFGPYGADIFSPTTWANGNHVDSITLEVTRVVIALSVFAVGVELPKAYVWKHRASLCFLLGPVMLVGWLVSGGFIYLLVPKINFLDALVIAACVTPTDPILAASVVGKGKFAQEHVPSHIRHILQAESGCNDGAAFPFLYFALFWSLRGEESIGHAIGWWIPLILLYQILLGIIIGGLVGYIARKGMKYAKYHDLIDRESMVAMYVALALLVTGVTTLAGSDDLLAAFACGTAFAWDDWFSESIEDSNFSSILDLIVNCGIFFYIGATIPFAAFGDAQTSLEPWRLVVLGICILTLRRIPTIFTLQKFFPDCRTKREALFMGHFGPMGVGALFIATLARERLPTPTYPPETHLDTLAIVIEPVVYFLILTSVLVHGLSIPVFTNGRRLHRRVSSFHRTFTAGSTSGGNEPGWLTKVRRAGEPEKTEEKSTDEKNSPDGLTQTPSTGSSTAADGEADDVMGTHDKGIAEEDGHPERVTRWREGEKTVVENAEGEVVEVDDPEGVEAPPKEIDVEAQRPIGKKVRHHEQTQAAMDEAEEHAESAESSEDDAALKTLGKKEHGHWWTRDKATGEPRELSAAERRQAKRDRAVRREKHYCTGNEPVRWREGNRIVIENNNGETVAIQELGAEEERNRPQVAGSFPHVHRVTGKEHTRLSKLSGKHTLDHAFGKIEGGEDGSSNQPEASTSAAPPKRPQAAYRKHSEGVRSFFRRPSPGKRPISTQDIRRTDQPPSSEANTPSIAVTNATDDPKEADEDEAAAEQPTASTSQTEDSPSPAAAESRQSSGDTENTAVDSLNGNLRFSLPRDDEVRRYDLQE